VLNEEGKLVAPPDLPARYRRPMPSFEPFKDVEARRPDFESESAWHYTKTINPDWPVGGGPNKAAPSDKKHVVIDPSDRKRDPIDNYSLMISGYTPRPIAFASTVGKDGSENLSPFSYTTMLNHDPPVLVIGFSPYVKNTFRNIIETGEATINIISEDFLEAANFACIDAPYGTSEWQLTGLTKGDTKIVKPKRVAESVFSIECKLMEHKFFKNHDGVQTGGYCLLEGVMFHIREDALDEEQITIDQGVLKSVSRLGGITYGRVTQGIEIPRPMWKQLTPEELKLTQS